MKLVSSFYPLSLLVPILVPLASTCPYPFFSLAPARPLTLFFTFLARVPQLPHPCPHPLQFFSPSPITSAGWASTLRPLSTVFTGMPVDLERAFRYYSKAAVSGDPSAFSQLGNMHAQGIATEQDHATALEFFRKGAAKGHAPSQVGGTASSEPTLFADRGTTSTHTILGKPGRPPQSHCLPPFHLPPNSHKLSTAATSPPPTRFSLCAVSKCTLSTRLHYMAA